MKGIVRQLFWFALTVLLLGLIVEVFTMQLPLTPERGRLGQQVAESFVTAALASLCASIGGSIAFRFFPRTRGLSVRQLLWTGLAFVVAEYVAANFLAASGLAVILPALIVVAFILVVAAGRWMARRDA
jgi:hypothetical protein